MKQKNGGPTLDGSATKRSIFELPFIAPYSTSSFAKKKLVDFDDELKTGDVRYDNLT